MLRQRGSYWSPSDYRFPHSSLYQGGTCNCIETVGLSIRIYSYHQFDPSTLVTPTPCKLVRYLVPDGEHISAGHAYAEVEVMKMYMPLVSKEPGILRHHAIEVLHLQPQSRRVFKLLLVLRVRS